MCIYKVYVRHTLEKTIQYTMNQPIATSSDLELAPHEKQLTRFFWGGAGVSSNSKPTNIAATTNPGVCVPPALSVVWLYVADLVLPALATLPRKSTLNKNDGSINTAWKQLEDPSFWSKKTWCFCWIKHFWDSNLWPMWQHIESPEKWQRCGDGFVGFQQFIAR